MPDQIGHWLYIFRVAGEPEAPKMPCILNGCEHGEMVECIPGSAWAVNVMGIYKRDHMSTARVGVTAPAGVAKARGTRAGEIAFVPHDENHRVSAPCLGIHDGADSLRQEQVSCCNQRLNLREVAGIGCTATAATMHVVALVRTDPRIIGHRVVGQIACELAEVHDVVQPGWTRLHVLVGNEGIVLALVELVATRAGQQIPITQRERLHISFPGLLVRLQLVNDVLDIYRGVAVAGDAIRGAGSGGNVIWLTGVSNSEVVAGQARSRGQIVGKGSVGIANQSIEASVFHHDHKHMTEAAVIVAVISLDADGSGREHESQDHKPNDPCPSPVSKAFLHAACKHDYLLASNSPVGHAYLTASRSYSPVDGKR